MQLLQHMKTCFKQMPVKQQKQAFELKFCICLIVLLIVSALIHIDTNSCRLLDSQCGSCADCLEELLR